MTGLFKVAKAIKDLTYDETMEMAEWFSHWTAIDDNGEDMLPTINRDTMAANLSDWADNVIEDA